MSHAETMKALIEAGKKAPQNEAVLGDDGWGHWWVEPSETRGGGTIALPFSPVPPNNDENNPYRPYTWDGLTDAAIVAYLNARESIALAHEGMMTLKKLFDERKAEWTDAVAKEYDRAYAERQFRDWEIGMGGVADLLARYTEATNGT